MRGSRRTGTMRWSARIPNQGLKLGRCPVAPVLLVLALLFSAGCQVHGGAGGGWGLAGPSSTSRVEGPQISVFLNLNKPTGPGVWLRFASIEILSDATWVPLISQPLEIDATQIGPGQVFVSRLVVPQGRYHRLRFTVEKAAIEREGGKVFLALDKPVVEVTPTSPLSLGKGDSESLFIAWDVEASLVGTALLAPALTVAPQSISLIADLAYVACPEIDTVYVVRTDKNWVCGSLGVSGRPTYLGVDPSRNRLYVLSTGESAIKVIELSTSRLVDHIRIPMTREPGFMTLRPDGRAAYVLDEREGYVIRIDLLSGTLKRVRLGEDEAGTRPAERFGVGYRPSYAAYLSDIPSDSGGTVDRLAVVSALSQSVFFLDPESLVTEAAKTVAVGSSPQGLLLWRDLLYVAEGSSNTVSVYDLRARRLRNRFNVGASPRRLLLGGNHIFVTDYGEGVVSVLLPGQLNVFKEIPAGKGPLEIVASGSRRWLYVGNQGSEDLTVIDFTSNRVAGRIALGTPPLGLAMTH